jgi:hypothetical protein
MSNIWQTLSLIDVNEHTEKKQGMTYLSWAWAWGIVKDSYPNAYFEKHYFDGPNGKRPYMIDEHGFAFVMVTVRIEDEEQTEILPVLKGNRPVQNPNSFDINTALQRCMVKCLAYFGLGHYIYAGEDLPPENDNDTTQNQTVAVEKKDPPSQASPAPSEPTAELTQEELDKKHDKSVYLDMQSQLRQMKHVNNVHTLFDRMKPKIQEIKKRNPEAAQHIVKLFLDAEKSLTKGEN